MLFAQFRRKVTTKNSNTQGFSPFFVEKVLFFLHICEKNSNFAPKN